MAVRVVGTGVSSARTSASTVITPACSSVRTRPTRSPAFRSCFRSLEHDVEAAGLEGDRAAGRDRDRLGVWCMPVIPEASGRRLVEARAVGEVRGAHADERLRATRPLVSDM